MAPRFEATRRAVLTAERDVAKLRTEIDAMRHKVRAAHPVPLTELAPGDLVFFRIRARGIDHVGVYAGGGRFIHAPRAGRAVRYGDLRGGGFYARRLVGAGRFWDRGTPPPR